MTRKVNYSNPEFDPKLYYRLANGKLISLTSNAVTGLTSEIITIIHENIDETHDSDLNERYITDPRIKALEAQEDFFDDESDDGIPRCNGAFITDENYKYSPENVLFSEPKMTEVSFIDKVHSVLSMLSQDQQFLYEKRKEGKSYSEIAKIFGVTKQDIGKKFKKLERDLKNAYEEKYGNN